MSYAPLILVVAAALIHAAWNLLAKRAADAGPAFVFAYNLVCSVVYAPWAIWVLAQGDMRVSGLVVGLILMSALVHLAYSLSLQRGYQVAHMSVVYPIARGTGPMLSTVGAVLLLGEAPTLLRLGGLVAVVAGILLITTQGRLAILREPGGLTGVRWGVLTGLLIASYTVIDAYGVKVLNVDPVVLDWCSNLLRFVLLTPVMLRNPDAAVARMHGKWRLALGVGVLSPLSYILVLIALRQHAPLSVVAPMREMSMMVGALMGMVVLREPVGVWRLVGCAILIGGVVLLSAG